MTSEAKKRRKREKEDDDYDILILDKKIKDTLKDEEEKEDYYINRIDEIKDQLYYNISYRKKKELQEELNSIESKIIKIKDKTLLSEYLYETENIISKYQDILKIPVSISFFEKKKEDKENIAKKQLEDKYFLIAKKYISLNLYNQEQPERITCQCNNNNDWKTNENIITCEQCGMEINIHSITTNFKDIDRINLSQKYKYSRRVYFKETISRYEGKQNKKISQKLYDSLEDWFKKHNLLTEGNTFHECHKKISKEHIYMALSETNNNLHYEDINLIHNQFTGNPCPDISHIKEELFDDFDKVMTIYDSLELERINSLNSQYILYQLLRRRKIKVNPNDFGMLKTRDRLLEYDEIFQKICIALEWTFIPTL